MAGAGCHCRNGGQHSCILRSRIRCFSDDIWGEHIFEGIFSGWTIIFGGTFFRANLGLKGGDFLGQKRRIFFTTIFSESKKVRTFFKSKHRDANLYFLWKCGNRILRTFVKSLGCTGLFYVKTWQKSVCFIFQKKIFFLKKYHFYILFRVRHRIPYAPRSITGGPRVVFGSFEIPGGGQNAKIFKTTEFSGFCIRDRPSAGFTFGMSGGGAESAQTGLPAGSCLTGTQHITHASLRLP